LLQFPQGLACRTWSNDLTRPTNLKLGSILAIFTATSVYVFLNSLREFVSEGSTLLIYSYLPFPDFIADPKTFHLWCGARIEGPLSVAVSAGKWGKRSNEVPAGCYNRLERSTLISSVDVLKSPRAQSLGCLTSLKFHRILAVCPTMLYPLRISDNIL